MKQFADRANWCIILLTQSGGNGKSARSETVTEMVMTKQIISVDIGGTHARFARAHLSAGRCIGLDQEITLRTKDFASLECAWRAFSRRIDGDLPRHVAMAVAGPIHGEVIRFTNNPWTICPREIHQHLQVDDVKLVNDFEAIGHAVAQLDATFLEPLCGPEQVLPDDGVISIIGPGTGLGVAQLWRSAGSYRVRPTEGGHIGFAPHDAVEDAISARIRSRYGRASVERVVSGPAIVDIYQALASMDGLSASAEEDKAIWTRGLEQGDPLASAAIDRFCLALGAVAGDMALAQGASGVVIAGGLGFRLRKRLVGSHFSERFIAKGRFEKLMAQIPVKVMTHPQPGLFGAAAAYAAGMD